MAREILSTLVNVLLVLSLIVVLGIVVIIFGLQKLVPQILHWGQQAPGQDVTGTTEATTPLPPYIQQIIRIQKTIPPVDIGAYNSYDDWQGSSKKVDTTKGKAVLRIGFNNPVNLSSLTGAIEVWQRNCILCTGSASKKSDYKQLSNGNGNDQWSLQYEENQQYTVVVIPLFPNIFSFFVAFIIH